MSGTQCLGHNVLETMYWTQCMGQNVWNTMYGTQYLGDNVWEVDWRGKSWQASMEAGTCWGIYALNKVGVSLND